MGRIVFSDFSQPEQTVETTISAEAFQQTIQDEEFKEMVLQALATCGFTSERR